MAIEDIFRALEEQADAEVAEILRVAQLQADAIGQEASDEADRITESRVGAAAEAAGSRAGKSVNAAKLKARRNLAAAREEAVSKVFDVARERLASMQGSSDYETVFAALLKEAAAGVEGEFEILVAPADVALGEKAAKSLGLTAAVVASPEVANGVVVSFEGGRIVRKNTFDSRLGKVRGLAQAHVAQVLTS
jgi:vacuolar-type H+-ATPase subunit E/Vma4